MRKFVVLTILLVMASLLAACDSGLSEEQVSEIAAQAAKEDQESIEFLKQEPVVVEVVMPEVPEVEEPELEPVVAPVVSNTLVNPVLFDAGEHPAGESTPGFFDIGINPGQLGLVFGWDLNWNGNSISSEGCEIVVLPVGWYENFSIVDGRYEVYTLPSADPAGWTQVLVDQRVAEQAEHYGCPADKVPPVWEGGE